MANTDSTRAAVLTKLNQPLELMDLELPELQAGQVLVDLAYSGVCHSQLLEARGKRGPDRFLPHTLGHEGSGIVRASGPGVVKVKPGDRVVLTWIKGDGQDVPATRYGSAGGAVNSGALSTFMTTTVTCENRLVVMPAAMPLREAALLGCAIPTGAGVVLNTADLQPGQSIAVFGAGGIGLSAVLGARLRQAGIIVAIDVVADKLIAARRLGATHAIDARSLDPVAALLALTTGRGVDVAVEAAGRRETMEAAFRSVRAGGGLCVLAGNLPHGSLMALDPMDLIRGKRIVGTWGGETQPDRDLPRYAQSFLAGALPLGELISHEYRLDEVNDALSALEAGQVARALVRLAD
jgi:S-(hydroxymethyl)glutathione dehydrogenase/alcohol dehydrogenase